MNAIEARALLFSAVEPGSVFWSREIEALGVMEVVQKIRGNGYSDGKHERTLSVIKNANPESILDSIRAVDALFITPESADWPISVSDLSTPPIGLVIKGNASVLSSSSIAIVGTRNPTNYGVRIAGEFASGFADREWAVISGGAYGIDSAAHKGALIAEGITIAVLATGVDIHYPAGNARLFAEITEIGALVSEVMPGVHAIPARFLTRNRLIAAISRATVVVEAAFRSGSLRTARDAAELMRPVMAIPGPITSPTSEGCHRLIGERSAEVVTSVADAMEFVSAFR